MQTAPSAPQERRQTHPAILCHFCKVAFRMTYGGGHKSALGDRLYRSDLRRFFRGVPVNTSRRDTDMDRRVQALYDLASGFSPEKLKARPPDPPRPAPSPIPTSALNSAKPAAKPVPSPRPQVAPRAPTPVLPPANTPPPSGRPVSPPEPRTVIGRLVGFRKTLTRPAFAGRTILVLALLYFLLWLNESGELFFFVARNTIIQSISIRDQVGIVLLITFSLLFLYFFSGAVRRWRATGMPLLFLLIAFIPYGAPLPQILVYFAVLCWPPDRNT